MMNVIYTLTAPCVCKTKSYVGEAKRPIRERLLEHGRASLSRDMQNSWGAYYGTVYNGEVAPEIPFSAKIVDLETMWIESSEKQKWPYH